MIERHELEMLLRSNCETVIELLLAKRDDYGTGNMRITGRYGIAVRLQDKVSRLLNLERPGAKPNFESKRDTYIDIIGYGLIGLVGEGWDLDNE